MNQREQDIAEARRRVSDLLGELFAAEDRLRELLRAERPPGRRVLAEVGSTIKVGGIDGLADGTYTVVRVGTAPGCSHVELRRVEP